MSTDLTEKPANDPNLARPSHISDSDEQDMNKRLDQMEYRSREYKQKATGKSNETWKTLWNFYLGGKNHWEGYPGSLTGYQQYTNNRIGRNIEIAEALLEEMHISADVQPREPMDEVAATLYDLAKNAIIGREHNQSAVRRASKYARILGCGFFKITWDDTLCGGLGDVRWVHFPSEDVYGDDGSLDIEASKWMFSERRMDAKEAETRFGVKDAPRAPERDGVIGERADSGGSESAGQSVNEVATDGTAKTTMTFLLPARDLISSGDKKEVLVQDWLIRDDPKRWPRGRHIIRVGKKIVLDEDQQYDHGRWPWVEIVDQEDPRSLYGDCAARQAIEPQRELNLVESLICLNAHLNTVSPWILYPQSGISATQLQMDGNTASAVIICSRPGFEPKRLGTGAIPTNLLEYRDVKIETIDRVMRIQDVIPAGARGFPSSGEVVRELRESQLVEIRQKADSKARALKRAIELSISLVRQFYTPDRWIRITGPLPKLLQGMLDPQTGEPIKDAPGIQADKAGEGYWVQFDPAGVNSEFDVTVVPSSWEPLSNQAQIDDIMNFYKNDPGGTLTGADVLDIVLRGPIGERVKRGVKMRAAAMPPQELQGAPLGPPTAPPGAPPQGAM